MTDTDRIRDALEALCARAKVSSDDDTDAAGRLVAGVIVRDRVSGERSNPLACALANWLRAATGVERLLVSGERAILPQGFQVPALWVELPAAVQACVRVSDAGRLDAGSVACGPVKVKVKLVRLFFPCSGCGKERAVNVYDSPGARADAAGRKCKRCGRQGSGAGGGAGRKPKLRRAKR